MADNVLKFRIDTKEYDANIKRASQVLTEYFNNVRAGGGTLMKLDDGVLEAVQSIGEFSTKADNARGVLRELTQATADMTIAYRSLTDEEKKSPLGQAMAQSIQQLTDRAGMMRDAMDDVNLSIKNVASDTATFDQIAGAANVATSGFQVLQGATKVLGIEMGDNVEIIAKLQAAMAVTNGLSQIQAALQKQSAFMQGVNAAKTALATAAQQAYAVVTGEATAAQVALNAAMAVNPYTWVVIAIGVAVAQVYAFIEAVNKTVEAGGELGDVIKNSMISPLYAYKVACDDVEEKEKRWQESLEDTKKIVDELAQSFNILRESMKLSGASDSQLYNAEYESLQKKRDELRKQLGNKDLPHDEWLKISAQIKEVSKAMSELNQKRKTYLDMAAKLKDKSYVDSLSTEREINAAMGIAKSERSQSQMGSENWNYWNNLEENLKKRLPNATTTVTKPATTGTTPQKTRATELLPQNSVAALTNEMQELQQQQKLVTDEGAWRRYNDAIRSVKDQIKELKGELGLTVTTTEKLMGSSMMKGGSITSMAAKSALQDVSSRSEYLRSGTLDMAPLQKKLEEQYVAPGSTKDKGKDGLQTGKTMLKAISQLTDGLQSIGIEIPSEIQSVISVMQGVIQVIDAVNTIIGVTQTTALTANTVAMGALTSALWANTATSFFGFANGGIVPNFAGGGPVGKAAGGMLIPGNSFSGDNLRMPVLDSGSMIGVNSGEVILNRAQAGVIASQLSGNPLNDINLTASVEGEKIVLAVNRYFRRTNKAESARWT